MSKESDNQMSFDPDYTTMYADGIKIKIDNNLICRLIFYEKKLELENDDLKKDYGKNLRFEVRIPAQVLFSIGSVIERFQKQNQFLLSLSPKEITDKEILNAWYDCSVELSKIFFDTDEPNKDIQELAKKQLYLIHKISKLLGEKTHDPK